MKAFLCAGALTALLALSACGGGPPPKIAGMSYVTEGKFKMGYDGKDALGLEKPVREMEVGGFYIAENEVTNEDYQKFLNASKHPAPATWKDGKWPEGETGKFPIRNVSFLDAVDYAKWKDCRLPTEAEWEFAARSSDSRLYPWGNTWENGKCNNYTAGKNGPVEVGSFGAGKGPFGTFDQLGNVWEWTSSDGPAAGTKMVKGGSYDPSETSSRSSLRAPVAKESTKATIGFRVAKD